MNFSILKENRGKKKVHLEDKKIKIHPTGIEPVPLAAVEGWKASMITTSP
jgi:hypothetical protein